MTTEQQSPDWGDPLQGGLKQVKQTGSAYVTHGEMNERILALEKAVTERLTKREFRAFDEFKLVAELRIAHLEKQLANLTTSVAHDIGKLDHWKQRHEAHHVEVMERVEQIEADVEELGVRSVVSEAKAEADKTGERIVDVLERSFETGATVDDCGEVVAINLLDERCPNGESLQESAKQNAHALMFSDGTGCLGGPERPKKQTLVATDPEPLPEEVRAADEYARSLKVHPTYEICPQSRYSDGSGKEITIPRIFLAGVAWARAERDKLKADYGDACAEIVGLKADLMKIRGELAMTVKQRDHWRKQNRDNQESLLEAEHERDEARASLEHMTKRADQLAQHRDQLKIQLGEGLFDGGRL